MICNLGGAANQELISYAVNEESTVDATIGNRVTSYVYDKVGNRLSQDENGVVTTYTYNDNDQILTENIAGDTTSYAYDANGNTLTKTTNMVATVYNYDSRDKLESMDDGTQFLEYEYDASGIRQAKSVDGVKETFLVDPLQIYAQVIAAFDINGNAMATYTYGLDRVSETIGGNMSYYHFDGLGSTRKLSDASGLVTDTYTYKAFGEVEHRIGSTANEYMFTGEQYDVNLGFYYLRARYYNPANGRMWGLDTYQGNQLDPRSLHKYLYAHADPVNNIDPTGNSIASFASLSINIVLVNRVVGVALIGTIGLAAYESIDLLSDDLPSMDIPPKLFGFIVLATLISQDLQLGGSKIKTRTENSPYVAKEAWFSGRLGAPTTHLQFGRDLTFSEAVRDVRFTFDVLGRSQQISKNIAYVAGGGRAPAGPEIHGRGWNYRGHYHTADRNGSHVFF